MLFVVGLIGALLLSGCSSQPTIQDTSQPAMAQIATQATAAQAAQTAAPQQAQVAPQQVQAAAPQAQKTTERVRTRSAEPELIKITGTGFGSMSSYEGYTIGQKRLMAIRASKLDAYRSLAEQLNGVKIDSNTQLSTLTARSDNFRARVNSIVKGARVVSVTPMPDNNYETVLEVYVDKAFFNNHFVYTACPGGNCNINPVEASDLCGNGYKCQSVDGK